MKKAVSIIMTAVMLMSTAAAFSTSAEEYEKYPKYTDFPSYQEYCRTVAEGIESGKYFGDFDGNGVFDEVDASVSLQYFGEMMAATMTGNKLNWEGKTMKVSLGGTMKERLAGRYELKYDSSGGAYIKIPLNNEILANIEKYGDVDDSGVIDAADAAFLLELYAYSHDMGDVNTDGAVDAADASSVLKYYAENSVERSYAYSDGVMDVIGDMNKDGAVDADDASDILKVYAASLT